MQGAPSCILVSIPIGTPLANALGELNKALCSYLWTPLAYPRAYL